MGWFSSKKTTAPPAPSQDSVKDATTRLQSLREQVDVLEKREKVLEARMNKELAAAREAQQKGIKTVALRHLKQKKGYEEQKDRVNGQILNLNTMAMKMEEVIASSETVKTIAEGTKTMEQLTKNMDADKIEDMMGKVQDIYEDADAAMNAIGQPIGAGLEDDDDLLAELDALDEADLTEQFSELAPVGRGKLPAVGTKAKPATEDEEDLEELERMMAG